MAKRIVLLGMNGCNAATLMGAADIFTGANVIFGYISSMQGKPFEILHVSPDGKSITCSNSYTISVDGGVDLIQDGDAVICQPFSIRTMDDFIDALEKECRFLSSWLSENAVRFELLTAVSSGLFLIAEAGLLKGKTVPMAWVFEELFRTRYPEVNIDTKQVCIETDNLLCVGPPSAWQDAYLRIIERYMGKSFARLVSRINMFEYDRRHLVPDAVMSNVNSSNTVVNKADIWIQQHLHNPISVEGIAEHAAVSPRTLIRHFQASLGVTPSNYIQTSRLEKCRLLLEISDMTFAQICHQCGYSDSGAFRRLFKKHFSKTPKYYRLELRKQSGH